MADPELDVASEDEPTASDETEELVVGDLIEEIAIDGMCGVY